MTLRSNFSKLRLPDSESPARHSSTTGSATTQSGHQLLPFSSLVPENMTTSVLLLSAESSSALATKASNPSTLCLTTILSEAFLIEIRVTNENAMTSF